MGTIMIKTYSDPSHVLTDTGLDKNCIHVTSTQEMIQGYRSIEMYAATPREGGWQLMTSRTLINAFYDGWFGDARYNLQHGVNDTRLLQCMEVGEMLTKLIPGETISIKQTGREDAYIQIDENLKRSMEHNTMQLTDALRLLTVLDLPPDKISLGTLSRAQQIVVYLYQQIKSNPETSFIFERRNTRESVQEALDKAVGITAGKRYANNTAKIQEVFTGYKQLCSANTIIFDSIFQLTPEILSAVYDLKNAGYTVYLIFNYRTEPEFRPIYKCWLDMYSLFDSDSKQCVLSMEMHPPVNQQNYRLAAALGTVLNGGFPKNSKEIVKNTRFLEFETVTEFANYVDGKFSEALKREQLDKRMQYQNTLHYMDEMVYSASREPTNILRVYHPQQFGNRTLRDFPMGKALTAMTKMWNPETHTLEIRDFGYLGDCLRGMTNDVTDCMTNVNTYYILRPYIEHLTTVDEMLSMVQMLLERSQNHFPNLSLYQCDDRELEALYDALDRINQMAHLLFDSCRDRNRFDFYQGLTAVLDQLCSQKNQNEQTLDMSAKTIKTLLEKARDTVAGISQCDNSNISASNKQLIIMLNQILDLTEKNTSSAKWIILDLVQVDGDILVEPAMGIVRTNHFAFLSDQDLNSDPNEMLPWPLDLQFFEKIKLEDHCNTIYKIFLRSRKEVGNFPKYALIYGILFSREPVVLSYVKNVNGEDREPFYLFRLLGLKPQKIAVEYSRHTVDPTPYVVDSGEKRIEYHPDSEQDKNTAQICTYRYMIDRLISRRTWYADRFAMIAYIKIYIINLVLKTVRLYDNDRLIPGNKDEFNALISAQVNAVFSEAGNALDQLKMMGILTASEMHEIQHDVLYQCQSRGLQILESIANDPVTPELHYLNIVRKHMQDTLLYPCDNVFFDKYYQDVPSDLWKSNSVYSRYADFDYHKDARNADYKYRFSCTLCPCKSFCAHGVVSNS